MLSRMIKHLTIRGLDKQTEAELQHLARQRKLSINKAALALIRKGAGIRDDGHGPEVIAQALDPFIGSWSEADEQEFRNAIAELNRVDESLWQ